MTRRQAVLVTMAVLAALTRRVRADSQELRLSPQAATALIFDLSVFTAYRYRLGDREVVFSPEELMDALTPPESGR